jgi:hypothetical protein
LVFLAVTVAVFLGVAFLVYVLIMALLRLGLPERVPLRRVLLPSARRLRENLGDYVLAASTSILLALTLMVKHDLVQDIRTFDMARVTPEAVAILFDFGLPADLASQIGAASLDEVVRPLLAAGKVEESDLLVRNVVQQLPGGWLTPPLLIAACIVLAVFYLLWLARRRYLALHQSPDSAPEYASALRSLLSLALCVGLLLASALPLARGGEKFLARSALDAMDEARRSGRPASTISLAISQELQKQQRRAAFLYCPECEDPQQSIWQSVNGPSPDPGVVQPLIERVEAAASACQAACDAEVANVAASLDPLRARFAGMENQLNQLQRQWASISEQQLPAAERLEAEERAKLAGAVAGLEKRLAQLTREFDTLPSTPVALEDLQRRVARLESQDREGVAATDPESSRACKEYASRAVAMQQKNLASGCNLTGARWSTDVQGHYDWCLGAPETSRLLESRAREAELSKCRPPKG